MPLDKDVSKLTEKIKGTWGNPTSNPVVCEPAIRAIESDIAAGKSYWDIAEEQYERWTKREDACLPCEREYVEAKESLMEVGERYRSLISPEYAKAGIAEQVREQSARELGKAEAHIKTTSAACNIRFPRVRTRLLKMKPLAHVGRWNEFMDNQKQLLSDFESDIKEIIHDISVKMPSYAVPVPIREIPKKAPRLTAYEREQLVKGLSPEEQRLLEKTKKLAEIGRKIAGGGV